MAKIAPRILSWNQDREAYILTGSEKPAEVELYSEIGDWAEWLEAHKSFAFQGKNGRLSLQKETRPRSQEGYWYAYQRQGKRMLKQYLGRSGEVTLERLERAAQNLAVKAQAGDAIDTQAKEAGQFNGGLATTSLALTSLIPEPAVLVLQSVEPLLEPKLRLPRLHSLLITRSRLLARLDEGLERKLTLISAPAGFGKTTLVRQWLADRFEIYPTAQSIVPKIAWVSLDPGDNDPVRFWRYIMIACQARGLSLDQTALEQLVVTPQPPYHPVSLQTVLITFLNELTQQSGPNPNILVLEDYHVITSSQLHESLTFFVENLPPSLHIIIITRHDPPMPLARLRGQGELSELHLADLRFSAEETWDFLQENNSYQFSEETVRQLDQHLEGWAVGLRLLILALPSLPNQPKIEQFLKTFAGSHRPLQDYFVTEVLNVLPERLQNFILQTSVLERLTPSLCDTVTSESDSAKLLDTIERSNLFLEPLGGSGEWYRYHALFAGAMQQELRRRFGGAALTELYNRASQWFEQSGLLADAIEAALHAANYEQTARLVEKSFDNNPFLGLKFFVETNEFYTMSRWLKELPPEILRQHPLLCLNYASALFFILIIEFEIIQPPALVQVQRVLDWAEEGWQAENQGGQLAQVFAFRALLTGMNGNIEEGVKWARRALEDLPREEQPWRGMVLNVLGSYELYNGQIDQARRYLNEARINTDAIGNHNFMRANMGLLAWAYTNQGELNQAAEYLNLVLAEARELNDKEDIIHSLLGLAVLSYEWNDLEKAWRQTQEVLDMVTQPEIDHSWTDATLIQARILQVQGQSALALQRLNNLLSVIKPPESDVDYQFHREVWQLQAQFYLENGNLAGFERWVSSLNSAEPVLTGHEFKVYPVQKFYEISLVARSLTSQGQWEKSLALLEPLLEEMQTAGRFRYAMRVRLLMALALATGKKLPEARQQVQIVLSQAHIEGFMRLFLDEGAPMANLLRATPLPTAGKALNLYRQKILQAFDEAHPPSLPAPAAEPLSPQEQRVLALLGAGLSYSDIARQLIVSVNTIKTQVKSIYQKLNVNNRQQAQEATRQLNSH